MRHDYPRSDPLAGREPLPDAPSAVEYEAVDVSHMHNLLECLRLDLELLATLLARWRAPAAHSMARHLHVVPRPLTTYTYLAPHHGRR